MVVLVVIRDLPANCLRVANLGQWCSYLVRLALHAQLESAERLRLAYQQASVVGCIETARINHSRIEALATIAIMLAKIQACAHYTDSQRWDAAIVVERLLGAMAAEHSGVMREAGRDLIALYRLPSRRSPQ